jgi:hypothetical protein
MRAVTAFFIALAHLGTSSAALAQSNPKAMARGHFERGVTAFDERRFDEAATEFRAAYDLSPAFAVLYNIGQVNVALGKAVEAVEAFEKYLVQGGVKIAAGRRREVEKELDRQRARIGTIALQVQPEGAEIRVDGGLAGTAPLAEPVRITAGKHTIVVLASGYDAQVRALDVEPESRVVIELKLDPTAIKPRIDSTIAATPPAPPPNPAPLPPPPPVVTAPISSTPVQTDGESPSHLQRTAGYVLGGLGVAVAGTGLVVAILGSSKATKANQQMSAATTGAQWDLGKADFDDARSQNHIGWATTGVGAVGAIAGLVLVLTAPSTRPASAWTIGPRTIARSSGLVAETSW